MTNPKGLLVTFEGNEGSGKSTQIELLHDKLQSLGRKVIKLREPGGTGLGELLRDILKTPKEGVVINPIAELLLMNASRAQLVHQMIRPALDRGDIVLIDRFFDSTIVYQGHGRSLDMGIVKKAIEIAVGNTIPNITYLLKIPVQVSEERRERRNSAKPGARDRFEENERTFFERINEGYEFLAESDPDRIKVIDAQMGIQSVHSKIWQSMERLL